MESRSYSDNRVMQYLPKCEMGGFTTKNHLKAAETTKEERGKKKKKALHCPGHASRRDNRHAGRAEVERAMETGPSSVGTSQGGKGDMSLHQCKIGHHQTRPCGH